MARRVTKFQVGTVYRVEWLDHYDVIKTWSTLSEIPFNGEARMATYGVCLEDGDHYVTLAGTVQMGSEDPVYSQVFRCLKSDIKSAKKLSY